MDTVDKNKRLRELWGQSEIVSSVGVHDAFSARLAEQAGLDVLFLGGFGVSASRLGLPDLNFVTQTEMEDSIRRITARLTIPLIADGDTGYGGTPQVRRTVKLFSEAGASGMLLEDQTFPKRCGHFEHKAVISGEAMVEKIKAAVDAKPDPDFLLFARTDARAEQGLQEAIDRVHRYCEAGADVAFIEAPESLSELERIPEAVPYPLLANMLTGGKTPILSVSELGRLGYRFAVCPIETLLVCGRALQGMFEVLKREGRVDHLLDQGMDLEQIKACLGYAELQS